MDLYYICKTLTNLHAMKSSSFPSNNLSPTALAIFQILIMRFLIIFTVVTAILGVCACGTTKRHADASIPKYYTQYEPVYDFNTKPSNTFLKFDKRKEKLNEYDNERAMFLLSKLDTFNLLNHQCDTIIDVRIESGDGKPFYYVKTRSGVMGEYYSRGVPSVYKLNPPIKRITYCFNGNPEERFGQSIIENPDSVLLSFIYQWDLDAVSDFLKYGMTKYEALFVYKYILRNGSIIDIQMFRAMNNYWGREINPRFPE